MKNLKTIAYIIIAIIIWYVFISLCAWSLDPGHWSGFARFMFGLLSVFSIGSILGLNK